MNIDWSKAPEDATHAGTTAGNQIPVFYKDILDDGYSYHYDDNEGWRTWGEGEPYCKPLIERPKKQEAWDGEGLPPVDCLCETFDVDANCWVKVEIYAHTELMGETNVCAKNGTDMFYGLAHEFRPIKTPEQLAAEERERTRKIGVAQMMEHIHFSLPKELWGECEPACYALYEAGYRKQ